MTMDVAPVLKWNAARKWTARRTARREKTLVSDGAAEEAKQAKGLTEITPGWGNIADVVGPYQLVDEDDQIAEENPADVEYSPSIA